MKNLRKNLRDEWNIFRRRHNKTQSQASLEMGWSASFFNQFLCGRRPINCEHIIKISNYFDISPDVLDPNFNTPIRGRITVAATTSGNPAPSEEKSILPNHTKNHMIWSDISLSVELGANCPDTYSSSGSDQAALAALGVMSEIPAGSSLICCDSDQIIEPNDALFPIPSLILWMVVQKRGMRAIINPVKPKIRAQSISRVLAILFV